MTGQEMLDMLEEITDDTIDETIGLQMLNVAKNTIETERQLEICKVVDSTQTANPGDTYLTSKTLPSDFLVERELYVEGDRTPYIRVPFEQRQRFQGISRRWYADIKNGLFYLTGSVSSARTINLFYIMATPDIELATSPVWPSAFHPLIVMKAAEMKYPADAGERGRSWDDKWRQLGKDLWRGFINWDARLKLKAMEGAREGIDYDTISDAVY
jgi:hypothetical protein